MLDGGFPEHGVVNDEPSTGKKIHVGVQVEQF